VGERLAGAWLGMGCGGLVRINRSFSRTLLFRINKDMEKKNALAHERNEVSETISVQRDAYRQFLSSVDVRLDRGITLTLKQHRESFGLGGIKRVLKLTNQDVELVAEEFMKRLNKRLLGRSCRDFKNSLFFLPVYERGSVSGRLHLHCAVGNIPRHIDIKKFATKVVTVARGLDWIDKQIDIDFNPHRGNIINYLTKTIRDTRSDIVLWGRTPERMLSLSV
jgi:hypothetical protein